MKNDSVCGSQSDNTNLSGAGSGRVASDEELHELRDDVRQRRWADALRRCQRLFKSGIATAEVYATCGHVLQQLGQFAVALEAYRSALVVGGENHALHDAAGLCCFKLNSFEEAASHFRAALKAQTSPTPLVLLHLGMTLLKMAVTNEAEAVLRQAAVAAPDLAPVHFHLGLCAEAHGQTPEALDRYNETVRKDPGHVAARVRTTQLFINLGRLDEALTVCRQILAIVPDNPGALVCIGQIYAARGMLQQAEIPLRRALARNAGIADAWAALGQVQTGAGDLVEAALSLDRALRAQPNHLAAQLARIGLAERMGLDDEASSHAHSLLQTFPNQPQLLAILARVARSDEERKVALSRIHSALQTGERLGRDNESILRFMGAMLCDKLGRTTEAFDHLHQANTYQRSIKPYHPEKISAYFARIREVFTAQALSSLPPSQRLAERPIFLVGMPRSGTSLAEQILASHPDVFAAGELRSLDRLLRSPSGAGPTAPVYPNKVLTLDADAVDRLAGGYLSSLPKEARLASRVTDKMPHNFQYVGLIGKLFPNARVIHCTRDARDVALSCYFQYFAEGNSFSYSLDDFAHYYSEYRSLMDHWKRLGLAMFELRYEELVSHPERMVRKLLEYCELSWNDSCLNFHENRRVVCTASYKQVREPFHRRSVGRWRLYEPLLHPVTTRLADTA